MNFFKLATPGKDGVLVLDEDDEVIRGITVTLDGVGMWPPPAVSVSAAPKKEETPAEATPVEEPKEKSAFAKWWWKVAAVLLGAVVVMLAPPSMTSHFVVLELAIVVGFYVIGGVSHTLHTPLMSVTNAISGIIIVGAILLISSSNLVVTILAFIAMAVASINIFGGFLVTHRMLKMFERSSD